MIKENKLKNKLYSKLKETFSDWIRQQGIKPIYASYFHNLHIEGKQLSVTFTVDFDKRIKNDEIDYTLEEHKLVAQFLHEEYLQYYIK